MARIAVDLIRAYRAGKVIVGGVARLYAARCV